MKSWCIPCWEVVDVDVNVACLLPVAAPNRPRVLWLATGWCDAMVVCSVLVFEDWIGWDCWVSWGAEP